MDIPRILATIRPGAKWRQAQTYAALAATWTDPDQTLPSEAALADAWAQIDTLEAAERNAAKPLAEKQAENALVKILRKHGLKDTASAKEIEAAIAAVPELPVKDAIAALTWAVALLFRRAGGADIHEHPELED